eukprot:COSAG01_NODE_378_length_17882_cov_62.690344_5_plen_62_part_00
MSVLSRTSDKFSVGIFYCVVRRPARELWPVGKKFAGLLANVASIVLDVGPTPAEEKRNWLL